MDRAQEILPVRRFACRKTEQLSSPVRKPYLPGSLVDRPKARPRRSRRQIQPLLAFAQERFDLPASAKLRKEHSNQQSFDQRRCNDPQDQPVMLFPVSGLSEKHYAAWRHSSLADVPAPELAPIEHWD